MIIEYIERLRTRPLAERRRFALLFAGSITLIIAAVWSLTLPARFTALEFNIDKITEEADQTLDASLGAATPPTELQNLINTQETWEGNPPAAEEEAEYTGGDFEVYGTSSGSSVIIATTTSRTE